MKKAAIILIALLLLLTVFVPLAAAEQNEDLTRGEFAAMLVQAAGMDVTVEPAELLVRKGILRGYPDGNLHLKRTLSRVEAVTLVARSLGLSDNLPAPEDVLSPLSREHWGFAFHAWLTRFGLAEGEPEGVLSREEGKAFLEKAFSKDTKAQEILNKSSELAEEIKTLRSSINSTVSIIPRPGFPEEEMMPALDFEMNIEQRLVMPHTIHQVSTMIIDIPFIGKQEMVSESYIDGKNMYIQLPHEETGEFTWYRFPEGLMPDFEQLMQLGEVTDMVPPGLEDYLYYQYLGTGELDGEEVYEIAVYGRVDDFNKFMEAVMGQFGDMQQLQEMIKEGSALFEAMSFWGINYLGAADYRTKKSEIIFILVFAPEFDGQPNPMEAMQMHMQMKEMVYNEDFTIEIPEEVLQAELLEFPGFHDESTESKIIHPEGEDIELDPETDTEAELEAVLEEDLEEDTELEPEADLKIDL